MWEEERDVGVMGACERRSKCSRCKMVWYCSRACQVKDWPKHKAVCAKAVQTTVSRGVEEEKMPKKEGLKVVEDAIVEKNVESVKPVVVEREYAKNVEPEAVAEPEKKKKKRKSLFRQNMEKEKE